MYVSPNFKSKKELKQALADGRTVDVFSPGPFPCPQNGNVSIEGPHYPRPHTWYARVSVADGRVVAVLKD